MLLLKFLLPLILCLRISLIPTLLLLKVVRLYITKNMRQLVCLIDHMKPFRIFKNRQVT